MANPFEFKKPDDNKGAKRFNNRLHDVAKEQGLTAAQFEKVLFSFIDGEDMELTDSERELYAEIKKCEEDGMTVDIPGKMLSEIQKREGAPALYYSYVDALPVQPQEKKVLKSILDENRTGEVNLVDVKTLKYTVVPVGIVITKDFATRTKNERAEALLEKIEGLIEMVRTKSYGIEFIPD